MDTMSTKKVRTLVSTVVAALALALPAAVAQAHGEPTCGGLGGIAVHGEHVIGDYVTGEGGIGGGTSWPPAGEVGAAIKANGGVALPGGPGPSFHFTIDGLAPGASFCNDNAHPNGFNTPSRFQP
jgi:hypothetical protein